MKIIAFIERRQTEVTCLRRGRRGRQVEKILRHGGLCLPAEASAQAGKESPARAPPAPGMTVEG
jgi:hypothetical protein